jgi:CheY-like chemotaxis protein
MAFVHEGDVWPSVAQAADEQLRALAAVLARATSDHEITAAVGTHALAVMGASNGILAMLNDEGREFHCLYIAGNPLEVAAACCHFPANAPVPIADAVRTGRPVLLENLEQRLTQYPLGPEPTDQRIAGAAAAIPLRQERIIGALGFTFPEDRRFDEEERAALAAVGRLVAAALGRIHGEPRRAIVLVVDDEPAVRKMLSVALTHYGFGVREAGDGREALTVYREDPVGIDLVLLDVQMPGWLDGPGTLLRLLQVDAEARVIFMSGNTGKYSAEQLLALGALRVLEKPFPSLSGLAQILRQILVAPSSDGI